MIYSKAENFLPRAFNKYRCYTAFELNVWTENKIFKRICNKAILVKFVSTRIWRRSVNIYEQSELKVVMLTN